MAKLTLSIDKEVIDFAHRYSQDTQQSISEMIEKYLRSLSDQDTLPVTPGSKTRELYGLLEGKKVPDKKEIIKAHHEERFGRS